jgi:hypothetical protein
MEQTVVNFLYSEFLKYWYGNSEYESSNEIIEKAKQIEKENIAKAWDAGKHQYFSLGIPEIEFNDGKEYYDINYNETYKK